MTAESAVQVLESAPRWADAHKALRLVEEPERLAAAFFNRLAGLASADPTSALRLARFWSAVGKRSGHMGYAYRAKALGERLRGKWSQSAQSFLQAGEGCLDPVERLSFQAGAVDSLARAGKIEEAVKLGKKLASKLDHLGERALAARVRLNMGNALFWADRYLEANKWLLRAIPDLDAAGCEVEAAAARLGLSTCELFGPNPSKAGEHAEAARSFFASRDMSYYADLCSINLAHDCLLRGRPDEGWRILLELRPRLSDSPVDAARVEEYLGDCYLKLNLFEEAQGSYSAAIRLQRGKEMAANRANSEYGLGQALLMKGDAAAAARCFGQAAARYRAVGNEVWAAAAEVGIASATRLRGKSETASTKAEACVSKLSRLHSRYHLLQALLESARAAAECGQPAEPKLHRAARIIRRHGYIAQAWEVSAIRASVAAEGEKLKHFRKAHREILSARIMTGSQIARMRFMRDKGALLASYIRHLLDRPSPASVAEAVDVVVQSRSSALIDEILRAAPQEWPPEQAERIRALRDELSATESEDLPGSSQRISRINRSAAAELSRRWYEASSAVLEIASRPNRIAAKGGTSIYCEAGAELYCIKEGGVRRLPLSHDELANRLKWLEFATMGPALYPDVPAGDLIGDLEALADDLDGGAFVAPDGVLWRVPWQAVSHLNGEPEPILLASPAFGAGGDFVLPKQPRTAVWYFGGENLPHVKSEVELLMKAFPSAEVCGTLGEVRNSMESGEFDLLHVAGHARFNAANPMFSFLQFGDGRLYAEEIARGNLRANSVVLSACETGALGFSSKEEPEGITRAFLACGSRAVLASQWPLNDEAALRFMLAFYPALLAGEPFAEAVAKARRACRRWREHPYYWAPLAIFGGFRC